MSDNNSPKSETAKFTGLTVSCIAVCVAAYFLDQPEVLWGLLAVGLIFNWNSN
jgi:hypothetical protein|tara:strand:- start:29205 stop:29363 length:159 start_codon:yes stop_codon:yes gene_type:complete